MTIKAQQRIMNAQNRMLQLLQIKIVDDIDKICAENNLKYYIIGGTLLGAVRHKGFIPWDDDIDLVMYRDDYNRFIKIIQEKYSSKYFIQTFDTDKNYTRYIAKVRLNNTIHRESYFENAGINEGVYVDIFPLDNVRKNGGVELFLRGSIVRWIFAFKTIKHNCQITKTGPKYYIGKLLRGFLFLIPDGLVNSLFEYACQKDNGKECKYTTNFASHFKWKKQLFENGVFGDGCKLEFEDRKYSAPCKYKEILERLYGADYMQLPPKEKRVTHDIVKLDFGPYREGLETEVKKEMQKGL